MLEQPHSALQFNYIPTNWNGSIPQKPILDRKDNVGFKGSFKFPVTKRQRHMIKALHFIQLYFHLCRIYPNKKFSMIRVRRLFKIQLTSYKQGQKNVVSD